MTCTRPPPPHPKKKPQELPTTARPPRGGKVWKEGGFGEEGGQAEEVGPWAEGGGCGQGEAEAPPEGRAVRATMEASSPGGTEHLRRSFIHSFVLKCLPGVRHLQGAGLGTQH